MLYPYLTSPITIAGIELKNRMVMSPLTTYGMTDRDGSSNERHRAYYEARARGGLGLIKVESAMVHMSGKCWLSQLAIHEDRTIAGLAELARTIKKHGPAAIIQLHHGGRVAEPELSGAQPIAPSPLPAAGSRNVPREMTIDEIEEIIEAFGQAARRAREAGFDGVELHMGTAYLLLSFISPAQNLRQDQYGADFDGRMRFPLRIIRRIRELAGEDYPIGARIVGSDYHDGGVDVPYAQRVARRLEQAGLAYLDVSAGQGPRATKDSPLAMGYGQGVFAHFCEAVKSVTSIPVMSVGRYYSLAAAEEVLAAGKADMIVFGRALIADPAFVAKSLRGAESKVIPCIGCQACHGGASKGLGASCLLNPETGHEFELSIEPAAQPKRVLVIGSGVPGLELARVAALRGHKVTLATAGLPFGGLLALRAVVPGAEEVAAGVSYFRRTLADLGVNVVVEAPINEADIIVDTRPGAPILSAAEGLGAADQILGDDVLAGRVAAERLGKRVAVMGPGIFAGETALYLAGVGKEVTLIASGERAMQDANPLVAGKTTLRLGERGGQIICGARVVSVRDGVLSLEANGERREIGRFEQIVTAIGWKPSSAPPDSDRYVIADAWDAFAALLQAFESTKLARRL